MILRFSSLLNGATPNFLEFKNSSNQVVASITTDGNINIAGSVTANGITLGGGGLNPITISASTPSGGLDGDIWLVIY
jgi:hypothetical protein